MNETKTKQVAARGRPAMTDAKRQRMRREIASIAKRLFQDEGYGKISMRRIAGEVGCSPMTLYKYYDAKIHILRTLWADVLGELFDQLEAVPETVSATDKNQLHRLGMVYVQYWLDHTEYYRLVFMADGVTQPDVSLFIDSPELVPRFNIFASAISDVCSNKLEPNALKAKQDAFLCFLNGITHNLITISGYPWSGPDEMIAIAVNGVTD